MYFITRSVVFTSLTIDNTTGNSMDMVIWSWWCLKLIRLNHRSQRPCRDNIHLHGAKERHMCAWRMVDTYHGQWFRHGERFLVEIGRSVPHGISHWLSCRFACPYLVPTSLWRHEVRVPPQNAHSNLSRFRALAPTCTYPIEISLGLFINKPNKRATELL